MQPIAEASQPSTPSSAQFKARLAGVFYLLSIITGMFAAFASGRLEMYGNAANLIGTGCYVIVTLLFYDIFKPVNKSLSLLAALFSLVGCSLFVLHFLHLASSPISPLVFFGFYCLLIGYLIFKSTFLPRFLGVLMAFAGLNWLTFLSPRLAERLSPYNLIPGLIGEGALTIWLLIFGLNPDRWNQQASAASLSRS
jgi:hypothetical protein